MGQRPWKLCARFRVVAAEHSHSATQNMPRNRKSSSKSSTPQPSASSTAFEISEEEQWRLINATGILGGAGGKRPSEVRAEQAAAANVKNKSQPRPKIEELPEGYDSNEEYEQPGQEDDEDEDDEEVTWEEVPSEEKDGPLDLADEIFESVLLIVPLCFLFALMDMWVSHLALSLNGVH